jgi:hypothetical protein
MNIDIIKNIGLILLAILLIVGGALFLVSGQLHLSVYATQLVYMGLAILAMVSGGFILLGK